MSILCIWKACHGLLWADYIGALESYAKAHRWYESCSSQLSFRWGIFFSYQYSWRTNSDIVGLWVGCLARARVEKWDIIRITHNIFDPYWLVGLESVVANIDAWLRIPLPEAYIEFDVNSPKIGRSSRRPCMVIRDNVQFFREWPQMELCIKFLLRWRGILEDLEMDWLTNYPRVYDTYIHPNVNFNNLEDVEFCLLNYD